VEAVQLWDLNVSMGSLKKTGLGLELLSLQCILFLSFFFNLDLAIIFL
jgi:hypothetical protein